MFIDESEGIERLNDPRNVLSRVKRDDRTVPPSANDLELNIPSLADVIEEVESQEKKAAFDPVTFASSADFDPFAALKLHQLITPNTPGRKEGIRNRTDAENAAVAVTSLMLGSTATEEIFGVSSAQQSILKQGHTGSVAATQGKKPKEALLEEIHRQGGKIVTKAFGRLDKVLDQLSDEKLMAVGKATDLTKIATGMAKVIQSMTPKETNVEEGGVHFHIYRPEQKQLSDYEMVVVGAGKSDGAASAESGSQSV